MRRAEPFLSVGVLIVVGILPLLYWASSQTGIHLPPSGLESGFNYFISFTTYYLVFVMFALGLFRVCPPRGRDGLLACTSCVFLWTALSGRAAAACILATLALYPLLRAPRGRTPLYVAWALLFYGAVPPHLMVMESGSAMVSRSLDPEAVALFSLFYKTFKRSFVLLAERAGTRAPLPALPYFNYMLGLPFLAVNGATPSFAHFLESRRADVGDTVTRGARACLLCIACIWALLGLRSALLGQGLSRRAAASLPLSLAVADLTFLLYFLRRMGSEQLSVGVWRLFGYDLRDDFTPRVFISRNPLEFWRRWNMLWRECLVTWFYYPTMLRLSRWRGRPAPWMFFAAGVVTLLGAGIFDLLPRGLYFVFDWSPVMAEFAAVMLAYRFIWGLLVGVTLYFHAILRGRLKRLEPWLAPLTIPLTVTTAALLHALAIASTPLAAKYRLVLEVLGL